MMDQLEGVSDVFHLRKKEEQKSPEKYLQTSFELFLEDNFEKLDFVLPALPLAITFSEFKSGSVPASGTAYS